MILGQHPVQLEPASFVLVPKLCRRILLLHKICLHFCLVLLRRFFAFRSCFGHNYPIIGYKNIGRYLPIIEMYKAISLGLLLINQ